jgi:hypothetical protein
MYCSGFFATKAVFLCVVTAVCAPVYAHILSSSTFYDDGLQKTVNTEDDFYLRKSNLLNANLYQIESLYEKISNNPDYNWKTELRSREAANIAQLCFQSGTYTEFAKNLLRKIITLQIKDKSDPFFGNFRSYEIDNGVQDQNMATFILPALIYIYREHKDKLDIDLRRDLEQVFYRGHQAILFLERHRIPQWYSNVYMKVIGTLVMLGDEKNARHAINKLYDFTKKYGINEYGQWNYIVLQLAGLQMAYHYAVNPEMKSMLKELLEFYWWDTVHNIHLPTKMYSSTSSRARLERGLITGDRIQTILFLYFGIGEADDFPLTGHQILLSDYQPPREMSDLLFNKLNEGSFSYRMIYGRVEMQAYQTNTYSLSTQTGRRSSMGIRHTGKSLLSSERNEITTQINVVNNGYEGIRFRVNSVRSDFDRFQITSVQEKNQAVVSYNFDLNGINSEIMNNSIYSYGELGHPDVIDALLVNGSEWNFYPHSLGSGDWLAFAIGPNFVGIRILDTDVIHIDNHAKLTTERPVLLETTSKMVYLKNHIVYDKPNSGNNIKGNNNNGIRLGYIIVVSNKDEFKNLKKFSDLIGNIQVEQVLHDQINSISVIIPSDHDANTLFIKEDIINNMVISRKINDVEIVSNYFTDSDILSKNFGEDNLFKKHEARVECMANPERDSYEYHYIAPDEMYLYNPHLNNRDVPEEFRYWQSRTGAFQLNYGENCSVLQATRYNEGIAEKAVYLARNDDWKIWLQVYWPTRSSNTFDIRINKPASHFFSTKGVGVKPYRIESDTIQESHWIATSGSIFLSKGFHVISVSAVDRYAALKGIIITNDPDFDPNKTGNP